MQSNYLADVFLGKFISQKRPQCLTGQSLCYSNEPCFALFMYVPAISILVMVINYREPMTVGTAFLLFLLGKKVLSKTIVLFDFGYILLPINTLSITHCNIIPLLQHIMVDLGTGNNNKINWALTDKQEFIDIVETVYRGARKGRGLVVSPKDYSTKYRY